MKATLIAWAHSRQLLGFDELQFDYEPGETAYEVIQRISGKAETLQFCRIAVNQRIHPWHEPMGAVTELAVLPPVSGG
jgi:molybdopterin converting factor small subunit